MTNKCLTRLEILSGADKPGAVRTAVGNARSAIERDYHRARKGRSALIADGESAVGVAAVERAQDRGTFGDRREAGQARRDAQARGRAELPELSAAARRALAVRIDEHQPAVAPVRAGGARGRI